MVASGRNGNGLFPPVSGEIPFHHIDYYSISVKMKRDLEAQYHHYLQPNERAQAVARVLCQTTQADDWTTTACIVASLLGFGSQLEDDRIVGVGTADAG